jgi:hypothetical protein
MCGSGTFLVEGALIATDTAPGLLGADAGRGRPLCRWHDFDAAAWDEAEGEARAAARPWRGQILGNDSHKVGKREGVREVWLGWLGLVCPGGCRGPRATARSAPRPRLPRRPSPTPPP